MKIHHALGMTAIACLWLSSLDALALDVSPKKQSLAIPVSVAGRPAGSVECMVALGPTAPITALAFSPDGKTLAVGGYQEVSVWDLVGARLAKRIGAIGQVGALVFLKDGKTLIVGDGPPGISGAIRFIDFETGNENFRFDELKDVPCSLSLSPDEKFLAASEATKVAHVWSLEQKKLAITIQDHSDRVLHVSFSPDGKFLTTTGADSTAQVWNVGDWKSVAKFTEAMPVRGAAFHPDALQVLLAVGGPDGSGLRYRKTDSPTFRRSVGIGVALPLGMVGPAKTTNRVFVPCSDKTVKVFDIRNGNQLATLTGHEDWVYSVAYSADEKIVASGSGDGTVKLWSNEDNRLLATLVQLAPKPDEWLIVTALGYFTTSSPRSLAWKAETLTTPPDELTTQLLNPEFVGKTIAGEKIKPPVLK